MFTMRIPSSVECNVIPIGLDFPKEKNPFLLYMFYIYRGMKESENKWF